MTPKEIHEDFMKTLENESPSYCTVKNMGYRESIVDGARSSRPKDAATNENVEIVQKLVMCDRRRDLRSIASEVGIRFWAVQTDISWICPRSRQDGYREC